MTTNSLDGRPPARPAARAGHRSELQAQRVRAAMVFLLPMVIALACVAAWPLLRTIYFSFTDTTLNNLAGGKWIGFDNYLNVRTLSSGKVVYRGTLVDPAWWNAVWNTFRFAIVSVSIETVLGLMVALVLNAEFKGRALVRAAILIPWAIPTIVSAKMWGWMLNDQFGIINDMLMSVGLIDQKIAWTANVETAMFAVLIVDIWKTTPFMALLLLAGLALMPDDLLKAAQVDGASAWQRLTRVILPMIKPAILVALLFRTLDAFRIFDNIYVLTGGSNNTASVSILGYDNLFKGFSIGLGSAISVLVFICVAIIAFIFIKLFGASAPGADSEVR